MVRAAAGEQAMMATECAHQIAEVTDVTTIALIEGHGIARAGAEQLIRDSLDLRVVASVGTVGECEQLAAAPDVVVLDLAACHPPDTARAIGALSSRSAVVVISRCFDGRDLVPAFQAGALGLVTHDTAPGDFVAAIQAAARGSLYATAKITASVATEMSQRRRGDRGLTSREVEALGLLAYGYTHGQIARRMGVAEATVNTYVKRIRGKLNAGNKAELTRIAIDRGYAMPTEPVTGGGRRW
jgi:DNA-binding NarL/FixJ family response regulator